MGGKQATLTVDAGAATQVYLCTIPTFTNGLFWFENKPFDY